MNTEPTYTAFAADKLIASGTLGKLLTDTKPRVDAGTNVLIFVDQTGHQIDFDFRGTLDDVLARHAPPSARPGPGRPKLGVVSREVSLLPRHWEWLETQSQGASASIRRLVEAAMKHEPSKQEARARRDAAGKFMWGIAGDYPSFEEASRALYVKDDATLESLTAEWPADVRDHLLTMVREASRLEKADSRGAIG